MNEVILGDCLEKLKDIPDNSVDSCVTDPPYELGFMGKSWDNTGIAYNVDMWKECLRVLKPGGHLLAFGGTRTYHRMAVAIEDAGFEVRDMIEWLYGSGFPKSRNIGKDMEKKEVGGIKNLKQIGTKQGIKVETGTQGFSYSKEYVAGKSMGGRQISGEIPVYEINNSWGGWGTALKPSHEPICMARKPISEKTVAENCLKWGTGGINIDESRVVSELPEGRKRHGGGIVGNGTSYEMPDSNGEMPSGRFPANLIHDNSDEVRECFPETKSGNLLPGHKRGDGTGNSLMGGGGIIKGTYGGDSGNASRFFKSIYRTEKDINPEEVEIIDKEIPLLFREKWVEISELYKNGDTYEDLSPIEEFIFNLIQFYKNEPRGKSVLYYPKASKSERNMGCEGLEEKEEVYPGINTFDENGNRLRADGSVIPPLKSKNNHPTVKPIALMEYLIKMITPKGGIVLDMFAGSGSTLVAAKKNGFQYIGIELTPEYIPIIEARLSAVEQELKLF